MKKHFDIIILNGRPAAGKSEVIDYLKKTPLEERIRRFHIAEFEEIDDFPMLWTWFEEDDFYQEMGNPRMHSDEDGYFLHQYQWNVLIRRICLEYSKRVRDVADHHDRYTTLIEFSRGCEHGGYREAYSHLSDEVLSRAALMYINVSYAESKRKNRRRFNPDKPDSILEHGLPDVKLERLYGEVDWAEISSEDPQVIRIKDRGVPYAVFENEPEVTDKPELLGKTLEDTLGRLWKLYTHK